MNHEGGGDYEPTQSLGSQAWEGLITWWINESASTKASLLLAAIAIVLAVVFYKRSQKRRRPSYAINHNNVFRDIQGVETKLNVDYDGQSISTLSVTRVMFWNAGNETIDRRDLAPGDALRIELEDRDNLLDARLIANNNSAALTLNSKPGNKAIVFPPVGTPRLDVGR